MEDKIKLLLQKKLNAEEIEIRDDSERHKGHQGAMKGGGHYTVSCFSPEFSGKSVLEQHRMVYAALADEMGKTIHALALKTRSEKNK